MTTFIRPYTAHDIDIIVSDFAAADWPKPRSTFEQYLKEQEMGQRIIWVAYDHFDQFLGYVTLQWQSQYISFREQGIPEIMDLNVLPLFRKKGVGSCLLETAEHAAYKQNVLVGLGVGLYPDYGSVQELHIKRGYVPDGLGITYNCKLVSHQFYW